MSTPSLAVFILILLAAAACDLAWRKIPNVLTAVLAVAGLILAAPHDLAGWASRGASFAAIGGTALALYLTRAMGGGDVKLLAAVAIWIPFGGLPVFAYALAAAGGLQALGAVAWRRLQPAANGAQAPLMRIAYGLSIAAAGVAWAMVQGAQR